MTAPAAELPAVAAQVRELQSLMRAASDALAAEHCANLREVSRASGGASALMLLALAQRDAETLAALLDAAQRAA